MLTSMKYLLAGAIASIGIATFSVSQASAAAPSSASDLSVKATLTADNHYGLFHGDKNGSVLNFVGRNEKGPNGSTGGYNWSHAESWDFKMSKQEYLYVVVWDDQSVDESWVGQFNLGAGDKHYDLLSKPDAWEYVITQKAANPGDWGNTPSNSELNWEIQNANWLSSKSRGLNDGTTAPWGRISEVTKTAEFLNTTTNGTGRKQDNSLYTIFRTKGSVADTTDIKSVPEPASMLGLLAVGTLGAASLRKRKQAAQ